MPTVESAMLADAAVQRALGGDATQADRGPRPDRERGVLDAALRSARAVPACCWRSVVAASSRSMPRAPAALGEIGRIAVTPIEASRAFWMRERLTGAAGRQRGADYRLDVTLSPVRHGVALTEQGLHDPLQPDRHRDLQAAPIAGTPVATGTSPIFTGYSAPHRSRTPRPSPACRPRQDAGAPAGADAGRPDPLELASSPRAAPAPCGAGAGRAVRLRHCRTDGDGPDGPFRAVAVKLTGREAARLSRRPGPGGGGRAALWRPVARRPQARGLVEAIIGPDGAAGDAVCPDRGRRSAPRPAGTADAVKAIGFFRARAVLVEEAGDALAPVIAAALADWARGRADPRHRRDARRREAAWCRASRIPPGGRDRLYADPPRRDEIEADLAGRDRADHPRCRWSIWRFRPAASMPARVRSISEPALYKRDDPAPLSPTDVAATAPVARDAGRGMRCSTRRRGRRRRSRRRRCGGSPAGNTATGLTIARPGISARSHAAASAPTAGRGACAPAPGLRAAAHGWPGRCAAGSDRTGWKTLGWIMDTDGAALVPPDPGLAMVELFIRIAMLRRD